MQIILHHYDDSSFSEKVRLMLGLKQLAWHAVTIPAFGPKPDYTPLTAGYRRTPALQIGADVYCDTRLIALELERRVPTPTLFAAPTEQRDGALLEVLIAWAEDYLFRPLAVSVTGQYAACFPAAFHADRAALHGKPTPTLAQVAAAARHYRTQFEPQLRWLEGLLSDARPFVLGEQASLADFAIYAAVWFLERVGGRSPLLDALPATRAWMERVAAIGHGQQQAMTTAAALAIAAAAQPEPTTEQAVDTSAGVALGDEVSVRAMDQHASARGTLVALDEERITLLHQPAGLGDIATHFPRLGYRVSALRA